MTPLAHLLASRRRWETEYQKGRLTKPRYLTTSSLNVPPLCWPEAPDQAEEYMERLGFPGQFPFTRGAHATMYRGKPWTMRQFSGFAGPEETNERYKYILAQGGDGLSVAFDLPTLMGRDPDSPWSSGLL